MKETEKLSDVLHQAFHVARSGRPGPVLVDIPKDVQFALGPLHPAGQGKHGPLQPARQGRPGRDRAPRRGDRDRKAADLLHRRRRHQLRPRSLPAPARARRGQRVFPSPSTLMGLGAYPASGKNWLGMLGMHGLYEANLAMHGCDLMINIGGAVRRPDHRPRRGIFCAELGEGPCSTSTPPRSTRSSAPTFPSSAMWAMCSKTSSPVWKSRGRKTASGAVAKWWDQIETWRKVDCLAFTQAKGAKTIKPQHCPHPPRGADEAPERPLHLHRGRPAPDVGRAISRLRGAEPVDDERWPRHHGLRLSRVHRRADGPPRRARHQRRGRGVVADEHAGDGHGDPVPPAGEAVHPQQRAPRHGPPVAGASPRRALFAFRGPRRCRTS